MAGLLPLLLSLATASAAVPGTVDLHAHLFMKKGMGWLFRGGFDGPLKAKSWRSRFGNQINAESLEASGLELVVVALYAHPILSWSSRESIRRQIRQAEEFVAAHPGWMIAREPAEARRAIAAGKRVLVFSIEGAQGVIDDDADLEEFVDRLGIRIVTLVHLTDNGVGGVAFLRGIRAMGSPWAWFKRIFNPHFDDEGHKVNPRGLTERGRELARKLIERKVWIDVAHASDATLEDVLPMLKEAGQPVLVTHGVLRRFYGAERGVSDRLLRTIGETRGLLGLCPTEDLLARTPVPARNCATACDPGACDRGLPALAENFRAAEAVMGNEGVMIGSDHNGAMPRLRPSCGTGTSLDQEGLRHIGQAADLWRALEAAGVQVSARKRSMVDVFLERWERVRGR
jgi:membrane dipeptidase